MVAGIIALALEANPLLTWRDVQHLLVKTSRPGHLRAPDWKTNGAGHKVSHLYGFGLVDADAIVVEAKKWRMVPPQHVCVGSLDRVPKYIRAEHVLRASTLSSACAEQRDQHVQVFDHSNEGFKGWEFMTVHCWGERAAGEWTLEIHDTPSQVRNPAVQGKLKEWSLVFYGTGEHPYTALSGPQARGRSLEVPTSEMEPSRAAFLQSQVEVAEEEEEYAGPCHPECGDQGCDGPNADQCLNCIHYSLGSVKTGSMCVSSCPAGFFGDNGARRCRRCHKGCERCVGRGPSQCTACKRNLYHHPEMGTCVLLCPPGFYAEERQKRCLKCHQSCKKCVGEADKCTACKEGFSLAGESCVPECQPAMYLSREPWRCETCPASTGPGEEDCTPCTPEGPAPHWRCVPACREGFYPADSHGLPNKVCKRYRTSRAKPGLVGSTASLDRIMLETAHSLMEIQTGLREPGQLWGWTPHAPALWISERWSCTLPARASQGVLGLRCSVGPVARLEECSPLPARHGAVCGRHGDAGRQQFAPTLSGALSFKCDDHCSACEGSSGNCLRCKEGYSLLGGSCVTNETCTNADKTFCEMVKSNKLCEKKLFVQFCCQTCLMAGFGRVYMVLSSIRS
ncbi:hypothetical protein EK904_001824 [Melospiza melodia maxima]|nr:hypothetical protein EK904_001824 [Melospiza melodia maxima]